jgi:hypothetical protein
MGRACFTLDSSSPRYLWRFSLLSSPPSSLFLLSFGLRIGIRGMAARARCLPRIHLAIDHAFNRHAAADYAGTCWARCRLRTALSIAIVHRHVSQVVESSVVAFAFALGTYLNVDLSDTSASVPHARKENVVDTRQDVKNVTKLWFIKELYVNDIILLSAVLLTFQS